MLLDTETHMLRLKALEEHCGPLCDLEKPVLGGEENFMGRVTAKVILDSFNKLASSKIR